MKCPGVHCDGCKTSSSMGILGLLLVIGAIAGAEKFLATFLYAILAILVAASVSGIGYLIYALRKNAGMQQIVSEDEWRKAGQDALSRKSTPTLIVVHANMVYGRMASDANGWTQVQSLPDWHPGLVDVDAVSAYPPELVRKALEATGHLEMPTDKDAA
jgi:hypothetical protein